MLKILFLTQVLWQIGAGVVVSRRWGLKPIQIFLSVFLLIQVNFIFTSYFLAIFSMMNRDFVFLGFSSLLSVLLLFSSRYSRRAEIEPQPFDLWKDDLNSPFSKLAFGVVVISSICFAYFLIYLGINTPLRVPDTVGVKLASSYYYLMNGNFVGKGSGGEVGRLFSSPFNVFAMWITLTRFGISSTAINVYHFVCWLAMFASVYLLGRELTRSRAACLFAAFSFCGTLVLLMQGYLDFDDLPASVTATAGAYFFVLWLKDQKSQLLALTAAGVGISFGAKMFPALFVPAVVLLAGWRLAEVGLSRSLQTLKQLRWQLLGSGAIFLWFVLPYPIVRFIEIGQATFSSSVAPRVNWPFDVFIAIHNLMIYNFQLLFFAVPDLLRFENFGSSRMRIVDGLNETFFKLIPQPKGVHALSEIKTRIFHYEIINPDTWYGFLPLAVLLVVCMWLWFRRPLPKLVVWALVFFAAWDIFFCVRGLYIEGLGRYWMLPVSLLAPILVLGWTERRARPLVYFVVFTTAVFAWKSFKTVELTNGFLDLKAAKAYQQLKPIVAEPLRKILREERDLHIFFSFPELPLFNFLNLRKHMKVTADGKFEDDKLNLFLLTENPIEDWSSHHNFAFRMGSADSSSFCFLGVDRLSGELPVYAWPSTWKSLDCSQGLYTIVSVATHVVDRARKISDMQFWVLRNDQQNIRIQVSVFNRAKRPTHVTNWVSPYKQSRLEVPRVSINDVSEVAVSLKFKEQIFATRTFQIDPARFP